MWIKFDEISRYIPIDGKFHDLQVVNNSIYVDGRLKNNTADYFDNVQTFNRALSEEEIEKLHAN